MGLAVCDGERLYGMSKSSMTCCFNWPGRKAQALSSMSTLTDETKKELRAGPIEQDTQARESRESGEARTYEDARR